MITGDKIIEYLHKSIDDDIKNETITYDIGSLGVMGVPQILTIKNIQKNVTYQILKYQSNPQTVYSLEITWDSSYVAYPLSVFNYDNFLELSKEYNNYRNKLEQIEKEKEFHNILKETLNIPEEEFLEDVEFKSIDEFNK